MIFKDFVKFQESNFDSFCKTVIRNECFDAHKRLNHQLYAESDISEEIEVMYMAYEDKYNLGSTSVVVGKKLVEIEDPDLAEALRILPYRYKEIIYHSFFLGLDDIQIAEKMHIKKNSVQANRGNALKRLRKLFEEILNEQTGGKN